MQALGQLELARELMPVVARAPSAAARTAALAHVWGAVVRLDLATQQARRAGDRAETVSELRMTLTEPFVVAVISATDQGADSLPV